MIRKVETVVDGFLKENMEGESTDVVVVSHWHRVTVFGLVIEGKTYWLNREDFVKALTNACNH